MTLIAHPDEEVETKKATTKEPAKEKSKPVYQPTSALSFQPGQATDAFALQNGRCVS